MDWHQTKLAVSARTNIAKEVVLKQIGLNEFQKY